MSRRRPPDFDLAGAVREGGFTPARTDLPALLPLIASDDEALAKAATTALLRVPEDAVVAIRDALSHADDGTKFVLARLLGRLPGDEARVLLFELVRSDVPRVRRAAIASLGRASGEGVEDSLLAAWPGHDPAERRALALALGKAGGPRSAELHADVDAGTDAELAKIVERAKLMRTRDEARLASGATVLDRTAVPRTKLAIELVCRSGLEPILLDELHAVRAVRDARARAGRVTAELVGAPIELENARTWMELRFPLPEVRGADDVEAVVSALTGDVARALFETFGPKVPRVRLSWDDAGPRRAATWEAASRLGEHGIVNDSRDAPWHARVRRRRDAVVVTLVPRGFDDERFAYRRADVPASSHPTVAAALARFAGVRDDDVVWDPFVGAGAELVERARLGPSRLLLGTDLDERAIDAARANLESAGARATLVHADALAFVPPEPVTLVLSNPPMGRRVHRGDVAPLLSRFLAHAATVLSDDARIVWLDPRARVLEPVARDLGFDVEDARDVDAGGFSVRLERLVRRSQRRRAG